MIEKRTIYLIVYSTYFTPSKYSEEIFGFFSDKSLPEIVSIFMPIGYALRLYGRGFFANVSFRFHGFHFEIKRWRKIRFCGGSSGKL